MTVWVRPGSPAVGVICRDDRETEERMRAMGFEYLIPAGANVAVIASVVEQAVRDAAHTDDPRSARTFSDIASQSGADGVPALPVIPDAGEIRKGAVVAVWGPAGAPGRSTVAVGLADELSRLPRASLLIDADSYGGVVAPLLGAARRIAGPGGPPAGRQEVTPAQCDTLAALCWQLSSRNCGC